jgi:hypothetical protein
MQKDSDFKVSKLIKNTEVLYELAIKSLECQAEIEGKDQQMINFFVKDLK